jgi:hypothetical protein
MNRKKMSVLSVGASAHPTNQRQNQTFAEMRTRFRPYISESGERNNGPTAYPSRNILTGIDPRVMSLTPKSFSKAAREGARMDEANGVMKVMADNRRVMSHLRLREKLSGILGSCWLSHPMMHFSRSVTGINVGRESDCCLLLLLDSELSFEKTPDRVDTVSALSISTSSWRNTAVSDGSSMYAYRTTKRTVLLPIASTSGPRVSFLDASCHCDDSEGVDETDDESPTLLFDCISCDDFRVLPGSAYGYSKGL